jgi:hypothetical protein
VRILQGNVGGSFVLARVRADSRSQFDFGKVSQSWITEQRAGQHRETGHEWEPPPFNQRGSQVDNAADAHPPDLEASSATIPAVTGSPRARTGMSASHQAICLSAQNATADRCLSGKGSWNLTCGWGSLRPLNGVVRISCRREINRGASRKAAILYTPGLTASGRRAPQYFSF